MNQGFHKTVAALLLCGIAQGANITTLGDWTETITAANLTAGAGSDIQAAVDSISGATLITLKGGGEVGRSLPASARVPGTAASRCKSSALRKEPDQVQSPGAAPMSV